MLNMAVAGIKTVQGSRAVDDAMGSCRAWMESKIPASSFVGRTAWPAADEGIHVLDEETVTIIGRTPYLTLMSCGLYPPDGMNQLSGPSDIETACDSFLYNFVCYAAFAEFFKTHNHALTLYWRIFPKLLTDGTLYTVRARLLIA